MASATPGSPYKAGATNGTTPADVEKQLETLRHDISELAQQVADLIGQAKDDTMAQVKSQVRSAKGIRLELRPQGSGREASTGPCDVATVRRAMMIRSSGGHRTLAMVAGIAPVRRGWRR